MLVPIGTQHLEAAYLSGGAHMTAYAGANVVVSDANQSDSVAHIIRQTAGINVSGQAVERHEVEGDGQVSVYQLVHAPLYLFLLLSRGFVVQNKAHLAFFPLHMGIVTASTAKEPNHGLVQQMLGRMGWWKLVFVMIVQHTNYFILNNTSNSWSLKRDPVQP